MSDSATERQTIAVKLAERSYPIEIGSGIFPLIGSLVDAQTKASHVIVIADENVVTPWSDRLLEQFKQTTGGKGVGRVDRITVPAGENSKSISQFEEVLKECFAAAADRQTVIIALGGGVVGDLAGYVAASYTRGIRLVQVPTTLLSMVDSSVGGKTGVNLPGGKNMVGAFWQPSLVAIDTDVLSTLPGRDYVSGMAEIIKYGVIDDVQFFDWLESNVSDLANRDPHAVVQAVAASCRCKARVVAEDERETSGRRVILNYGHTFAHAIEATTGYGKYLHGEAVAIGMQMAAGLAIQLELCESQLLHRQSALLKAAGLPVAAAGDVDPDRMLPAMAMDKKVAHGKLRFILPSRIGRVEMVGDVDQREVRRAIERFSA